MNFAADFEKVSTKLADMGALVTMNDGFTFVDEARVPVALLSTYRGLVSYGYANGLI